MTFRGSHAGGSDPKMRWILLSLLLAGACATDRPGPSDLVEAAVLDSTPETVFGGE